MDQYNSKHLGFIFLGVTIVSLKSYPTVFVRSGGKDTWIAMIASSFLFLIYMYYMLKVFQKHKDYSLHDIYRLALGKKISTLFLYLFIIALFITLVESASVESNSMHDYLLPESPIWYILIFFIIPTLYSLKKGHGAIMVITLIAMVLVTLSGINLAILTQKYKKLDYLKPILANGITPGILKSMLQILGLYGCASIGFLYVKEIKNRKKFLLCQIISAFFIAQMQIFSVIGIISTFEISFLKEMNYPKLLQTQLIEYFGFIEFGEFFVMLQILGGWYIKYVLTFLALILLLREIHIKLKTTYLMYIISALVYVCSYFASRNTFVLFQLLEYYTYFCLFSFILIPFLIFFVFNRRIPKKRSVDS